MALKPKQLQFLDLYRAKYGDKRIAERQEIVTLVESEGIKWPSWLTSKDEYRAGRGMYNLPTASGSQPSTASDSESDSPALAPAMVAAKAAPSPEFAAAVGADEITLIQRINGATRFVPEKAPWFVPWGTYKDICDVIKSRLFFPVFVTGLSGNGKTLGIEQACARLKRELFRVNITCDTDEDDLLGGFRLIDGQTVFVPGPAVEAMERGAILLLDEMDLGTAKIMCLQPILEGKGVFLKKVGRWVRPQPGFNILVTANTKGQGDGAGKFIGTNVLNEAMLDRFPITIEQPYPNAKVETKILDAHMIQLGLTDTNFRDCLIQWASNIRKTHTLGEIDEVISTRRLVNVLTCYAVFNKSADARMKAIRLSIARFDDDTKASFLDFYRLVDAEVNKPETTEDADSAAVSVTETEDDNDCPF